MLGECPICCVPIPFGTGENGGLRSAALHFCCSKLICDGCSYESRVQGLERKCPFCRTPDPETDAEAKKMFDKQVKRGIPVALSDQAKKCWEVEGNYSEAVKYMREAAKGGDAEAHLQMGRFFFRGNGVDEDREKAIFHLEESAIRGHPKARVFLGMHESIVGNYERAVKHFIIGSKLGSKEALEWLKKGYKIDVVSKEAFEEALRGYQEAVNAMKTPQREAAIKNPDVVRKINLFQTT